MTTALVTGAGGFIGHHLVRYLHERGYYVIGVDLKYPEFGASDADVFSILDLRSFDNCLRACRGVDEVYGLCASMGGMGFISTHHADLMRDNVLMNANMLEAVHRQGVKRYLFTSSACVYPEYRQEQTDIPPLKEPDAYPAQPDTAYGWEKLFAERLCLEYRRDYGLETRIARLHNVMGEMGTYQGGREKAPAALSRKIALANDGDTIDVWGDGEQTRSFLYVGDCVEALYRLMRSNYAEPINIGSDRLVSINELVDLIAVIAGKTIHKRHDLSKPQGVRGRNADLALVREVLGWQPETSLEEGLARVYHWVAGQVEGQRKKAA